MLAAEVPPRVFLDDIRLELPACRIGDGSSVHAVDEIIERLSDVQHLYWIGPPPATDEPARNMIETLRARDLLTEPFARASLGLREAFTGDPHVVE